MSETGKSQTWETGTLLGASNYIGELAPYPVPEESNFAAGVFVKRNLGAFFSAGLSANYASISGDDQHFDHLTDRNLNFRTNIIDFSATIEYNFFPFAHGTRSRHYTPYIFTGLSFFMFEPQGHDGNNWVDLRPLRTEGQGLPNGPDSYNPYSFAIPIGLGYKFVASNDWIFGFQSGFRYAFTDYIDDVSGYYYDQEVIRQELGDDSARFSNPSESDNYRGTMGKMRGNPETSDWYIFARVMISYRISNPVCYKF